MTHQVFISYAREDEATAQRLVQALNDAGFHTWRDVDDLYAGVDVSKEVAEAIQKCTVFILLLSKYSHESDFVHREVTLAFEENKKIIPLRIDSVPIPDKLRIPLASLNWMKLSRRLPVKQLTRILGSVWQSLPHETRPEMTLTRRKQSLRWVMLSLVLICGIGFLGMLRIPEVDIQMEIQLRGIEMILSDTDKLLFDEPVRLASIGASGLSGIQRSSEIKLPEESLNARAILIESVSGGESPGLITFNLNLPAHSNLKFVPGAADETIKLALWQFGDYTPDISLKGNLLIIPQRYGRHAVNVSTGSIRFKPEYEDELSFDLMVDPQSFPVTLLNINVERLSFLSLDLPDQLAGLPPESMIESGQLFLGKNRGAKIELFKGQNIRFDRIYGTVRELKIAKGKIALFFEGSAQGISTDIGGSPISLMPTYFEYLKNL